MLVYGPGASGSAEPAVVFGVAFFNPLTFPAPPAARRTRPGVAAPGPVTKLKIASKGPKRIVSWQPATGATSYAVTIAKGKKTVLATTVTTAKLTVKAKKLPAGKLKVTVTPLNSGGAGAASKAFKK